MSYQPHLHKGGELYHFRTKGSKNGVSNTPGYKAVGKKALGFLNSAGQYVYNNASKAVGSAGNWMRDRGRDVSKAATNAYNSAKESVTGGNAKKTYQNKKTLVDNTSYYNRNGGTVHMDQVRGQKRTQQEQAKLAKQQYDRSLFGRAENAGKVISKAAGSAGKWLSDRGEDISNTTKKAGKNISRATKNLGNNVAKTAGNIGEFLTGNKAKAGANRQMKVANKASDEYWNALTGKDGEPGNMYSKMASADKVANTAFRKAQEYEKQYDKTLPGRAKRLASDIDYELDRLGRNVSDAAKKTSKTLDSARKAAGNWLSDRGEDISRAAGNARNKVFGDPMEYQKQDYKARLYEEQAKDPVRSLGYAGNTKDARPSTWFDKDAGLTGRDYSQQIADKQRVSAGKAAKARQAAKNETFEGKLDNIGKNISKTASNAKKSASKALNNAGKNAKDFIERGRETIGNAWDGSAGKGTAKDNANYARELAKKWPASTHHGQRSQLFSNAAEQDAAYNKSIVGRAENLGKSISKTASDAKKSASKAISGAGKAAGRAAKSVGNFASTSFESAKKTVGEGANRAGDFISGLFGKKKPKKASKPTRSKK